MLGSISAPGQPPPTDGSADIVSTPNAKRGPDDDSVGTFLAHARIELDGGIGDDFTPLQDACLRVLASTDADMEDALAALCEQLPAMSEKILAADHTAAAYFPILSAGLVDGLAHQDDEDAGRTGNDSLADAANFTRPVRARGAGGSFRKKAVVHLRTGQSTATEAAHLQPGDRVMIDDRPITVRRVGALKRAGKHIVHVHGVDDLGQPAKHRFEGGKNENA